MEWTDIVARDPFLAGSLLARCSFEWRQHETPFEAADRVGLAGEKRERFFAGWTYEMETLARWIRQNLSFTLVWKGLCHDRVSRGRIAPTQNASWQERNEHMGIFDFLGSGYDERPAEEYEQPQTEYPTTEYPTIETEQDTSKLCRACSGGLGDGICSYHAEQFRMISLLSLVGGIEEQLAEEIAPQLMEQIKRHQPDEKPPALATDGKGAYREAMLQTWGRVPEYSGKGRPPTALRPEKEGKGDPATW